MDPSLTPRKEKKGLGRLWTKLKSAIRSKSKTEIQHPPATSNVPQVTESQTVQSSRSLQPETATMPQTTRAPEEPVETDTQPTTTTPIIPAVQQPEPIASAVDQESDTTRIPPTQSVGQAVTLSSEKEEMTRRIERAQAIFRKYNVDLDEVGWDTQPRPHGERVFKAPRIRVRWTCHECKTTFGHDKICVECAHPRCKSCERYPPRKKKAKAAKRAAAAAAIAGAPQEEVCDGACHECQTAFDVGTIECSNCHHRICERCLQETFSPIGRDERQPVTTT